MLKDKTDLDLTCVCYFILFFLILAVDSRN